MQEQLNQCDGHLKTALKKLNSNTFVMLYPTSDIFMRSFDGEEMAESNRLANGRFGRDFVIGINGQVEESDYDLIFSRVTKTVLPEVRVPSIKFQQTSL